MQEILKSHEEEIFDDGVTYQQQMKFVYTLIYSPNKSAHRDYQAIADLFGVAKGTAYNTIKRMDYKKKKLDILPYFHKMSSYFWPTKLNSNGITVIHSRYCF